MSFSSSSSSSESDDDDHFEHILEIDLDGLESHRSILTARRATISNFHQENRPAQEDFDIAASIVHHPGNGQEPSLRVVTRSPGSGSSSSKERWLHLATESISFEDFKRHAINITLEHHANWVPVVMYLLNNIKDNHERSSVYGSYIIPGTVIRCDGMERQHRHKPDLSVTFVSFPFFDVGYGDLPVAPDDDTLHLTRSLFQHFYPQENTKDRDDDQQFRRFKPTRSGQYLRVPQLWALILNSSTIITCGPTSLVKIAQGWLEIVPEDRLVNTKQYLIHVTDFHKRVTFLSPEQCGSYLALRQSIQDECLSKTTEHIDMCKLHLGENEATLDPSLWPTLLKDTQTAFLYIRISRKGRATVTQDHDPPRIEAPDVAKMIEYTDLGSDNESAKGKELSLFARRRPFERASKPSNAATFSRISLEDQGYVVNTRQSLQDDDPVIFGGERPKIFRRPTMADAEAENIQTDRTSSLDSSHHSKQVKEGYYDSDSPEGDCRLIASAGKQVRFQYVGSEDGWESESFPLGRNAPVLEGKEEDNVSGTAPSSSNRSSAASSAPSDSPPIELQNQSLMRWSDPTTAVKQAKSKSLHARVDDYDSPANSAEEGPVDQHSDSFSADAYGMPSTPAHRALPSSRPDGRQASPSSVENDASSVSTTGQSDNRYWTARHLIERPGTTQRNDSTPKTSDEQELKQVVRDEIAAALKYNDEQFKQRHEDTMRYKLAQFGFQEDQILAMMHPEKQPGLSPNLTRNALQPTYAKVRREYLDIETLHYYDIPYEYDTDRNYIIILREMSQREVDILFEHTRRLRGYPGSRTHIEADDRDRSGKKEYAFVYRKPRSKSRGNVHPPAKNATPPSPKIHSRTRITPTADDSYTRGRSRDRNPEIYRPSGSNSDNNRRLYSSGEKSFYTNARNSWTSPIYGSQVRKREDSPDLAKERFNLNLRVPPFLAWPTTLEKREIQGSSRREGKVPLDVEADEGLRTMLTLLAIKARIYKARNGHGDKMYSSNLVVYKSVVNTVEISKRSCPKRLFRDVDLGPIAVVNDKSSQDLSGLHKELIFLQSRNNKADMNVEPELAVTALDPVAAQGPPSVEPSSRRVIAWQMAKLYVERDALVSALRELISQFVPEFFDHTLIQRCWGSVETISKILVESCKEIDRYQKNEADQRFSTIFIVGDVPSDEYLDFHGTPKLSFPIDQCSLCRREKRYPDIDDALEHLQQAHTESSAKNEQSYLRHWLLPTSAQELERRDERLLEFVETLHRCTERLLTKAIDIRSSVADKDSRKGGNFLLPTALVKAAEKTFQYIYYSAHSLQMWQEKGLVPTAPKGEPPLLADQTNVTGAEYLAKIAGIAMSNARDELMLMAHTGESRHPVLHIRTTPESNIFLLLVFLIVRPLFRGLEINELYRDHLECLRYEASRKPSKRILRELYLWKEEVEIIESVWKQQVNAIRAMRKVFNSDSFRITSQVRIEAFNTLEGPGMERLLKVYQADVKRGVRAFYRKADKLAESLRYNIAIAEEGNSKAILIFTLVTIVFLPLSFVSSVFGMNTVDVRDMASTQTLFWAVALPVTAAVGGMSLLAAYGGPSLRRHIQNLKNIRIELRLFTFRRHRSDDEEQPGPRHYEQTRKVRNGEGRGTRGIFEVTKREILLRRKSNKTPPTHSSEAKKLTSEDMFFR